MASCGSAGEAQHLVARAPRRRRSVGRSTGCAAGSRRATSRPPSARPAALRAAVCARAARGSRTGRADRDRRCRSSAPATVAGQLLDERVDLLGGRVVPDGEVLDVQDLRPTRLGLLERQRRIEPASSRRWVGSTTRPGIGGPGQARHRRARATQCWPASVRTPGSSRSDGDRRRCRAARRREGVADRGDMRWIVDHARGGAARRAR